jgi:hypothetical protein
MLETEPPGARCAVAGPTKPRVTGEDLNPGANDEHHEKHVEEVLQLHPPRKSSIDRGLRLRDTRVSLDKGLHGWMLSQTLGKCGQEDERRGSDR